MVECRRMLACPECSSPLPAEARRCRSCGKTFLAAFMRRGGAERAEPPPEDPVPQVPALEAPAPRATKLVKNAEADAEAGAATDWKATVATILAAVILAAVIDQALRSGKSAGGGKSFVQKGVSSLKGMIGGAKSSIDEVRLRDSQLIVGNTAIEATGKVINNSKEVILQAQVITHLSMSTGRKLPKGIGVVRFLEPGKAAFFRTKAEVAVTGEDKMKLGWQSELGEVIWGRPAAAPSEPSAGARR